jgi:cytochrome P450
MTDHPPLLLTRYRDVRAALDEPALVIHKPLAVGAEINHVVNASEGQRSHRILPLRQSLAQHLASRAIAPIAGFIEASIEHIVSQALARGGMDAVADLAFPLPVMVMLELLGLPHSDPSQLRPLFEAITRGHDMGSNQADRQHARFAQTSLIRWLGPQIRRARATPLLKAIRSVGDAKAIDPGLVDYWCMMLLYAGSATTRDLIANSLALMIEFPEAAGRLARNDAQIELALEEILRFEGPVRGIGRVATKDLTIAEHQIQQGTVVYLMLSEANRDPEQFSHPDTFDLDRSPNPHLAFATGVTHCLGAQLARLEGRIVLARMRALLPHMTSRDLEDWSPVRLLRQRKRLQLEFH